MIHISSIDALSGDSKPQDAYGASKAAMIRLSKSIAIQYANYQIRSNIILPGAAYTEKNGLFVNLEGKLQKSYKASYPPGDAKEDWKIFKEIAGLMKRDLGFADFDSLRDLIIKSIEIKSNTKTEKKVNYDFINKEILVEPIDYYYTNAIARSSKVMSDCRQISKKYLYTGIEKAS